MIKENKMTRDSIILTYKNDFNPLSTIGIWSWGNTSNIWLSRERKDYPALDIKRRKISDIIDNDRIEEKWLKVEILLKLYGKVCM